MEQEADRVTKDRLRQAGSLLRELEEERERYTRELRHHKRLEECYGVGCLFGRSSVEMARDRLVRIEQIARTSARTFSFGLMACRTAWRGVPCVCGT